jgi:hypothetical protein
MLCPYNRKRERHAGRQGLVVWGREKSEGQTQRVVLGGGLAGEVEMGDGVEEECGEGDDEESDAEPG